MLIIQTQSEPAVIRNAMVDLISSGVGDLRVAAAYVTVVGSNILLDAVENKIGATAFSAIPKRLVTSFDFGLTDPLALRRWTDLPNSTVLVSGSQALAQGSLMPLRAFHPKLYAFASTAQNWNVLVGSANLTSRGLSINTEAASVERNVAVADLEAAFAKIQDGTTALTPDLLASYTALRQERPPPPEIEQEIQPVAAPAPIEAGALTQFRSAIENGAVNPANFRAMWVQGEGFQGGSQNQLELPRGGHKFFGFNFNRYSFPGKLTIGQPVLKSGSRVWNDRLLTWHGHNGMERMNLPTAAQGGFNYVETAVMFRRLADATFELIVTPWDSDLARSWRQASAQLGRLYRLGSGASNRVVGLL